MVPCAVPPHLLEGIAKGGSSRQKLWARRALRQLETLREQRMVTFERDYTKPLHTEPMRRAVYDAQGRSDLPGRLVREEGDPPSGDAAVDEAYELAGVTYAFYKEVLGRDSLDDRGAMLVSSVHYGEGFDNAFWNGRQMVYGDGDEDLPEDERLFRRFTASLEIAGHELSHGVVQYEANLRYGFEPGALNESIADVMGVLVKQWHLGQTVDEADWLIGADLFTGNVNARAIRSMREPGTAYDDPVLGGRDPQPAHYRDYVDLPRREDSGGVHINSGIPNRAFYVAAYEMGGKAWERAGRIWYYALRDRMRRRTDFKDAAYLTYRTAGDLYGENSKEQVAVRTGWEEVGVPVEG